LGELWTAVQEQPDICFLVMNDKGYGVIRHIQDASYGGRHFFDDLLGPDLEGLAKLAGLPFWRVRSSEELGRHLAAALQKRGPTLVEVDMGAIGPFRPAHQAPQYASKS
jgi:acetolactate synthase-1/2/3 large subunit